MRVKRVAVRGAKGSIATSGSAVNSSLRLHLAGNRGTIGHPRGGRFLPGSRHEPGALQTVLHRQGEPAVSHQLLARNADSAVFWTTTVLCACAALMLNLPG